MAAKKTQAKKPAEKAPETKLGTFLASKKIDARRVIAASHKLETLRPEDREIRLSRRRAKGAEGGEAAAKEERKPRSGRPVTPRAIADALAGKSVSGPTKHRIVRAVNHLLEQKKAEKIDIRALF
jgi:NAD(P)H-hydrate repair Nnr-like enzyme with NAD(P)H-hydrate epimerase domain